MIGEQHIGESVVDGLEIGVDLIEIEYLPLFEIVKEKSVVGVESVLQGFLLLEDGVLDLLTQLAVSDLCLEVLEGEEEVEVLLGLAGLLLADLGHGLDVVALVLSEQRAVGAQLDALRQTNYVLLLTVHRANLHSISFSFSMSLLVLFHSLFCVHTTLLPSIRIVRILLPVIIVHVQILQYLSIRIIQYTHFIFPFL